MYKRTISLILLLAMFTFASSALGKGMIMNENFGITEPDEIMKTIPASLDVLEAVKDEATNAVSNESNDLGISEPEENTEETASDDVEPIEATEVKSDDVKVFETSADFELTEKIEITVSADVAVKEVSEDIIDTASVETKDAKDVQVVEPVGVEEEVKLPVSQITPDEFRRMCAGASNEMILNAIKNRNADVNAKDYYDVTPLMFAAEKNSDAEVINVLIASGAKPDAKDKDGKTALMYAAKSNPSSNIIIALASGGANFNARDNNKMTALMYAARNNNAEVVKAIIDGGAEELADKRGWTPLFWAARYTNYPEVIGILLDAAHDPQARAHDMSSPIDHANKNPKLMNTKDFLRLEEESR